MNKLNFEAFPSNKWHIVSKLLGLLQLLYSLSQLLLCCGFRHLLEYLILCLQVARLDHRLLLAPVSELLCIFPVPRRFVRVRVELPEDCGCSTSAPACELFLGRLPVVRELALIPALSHLSRVGGVGRRIVVVDRDVEGVVDHIDGGGIIALICLGLPLIAAATSLGRLLRLGLATET